MNDDFYMRLRTMLSNVQSAEPHHRKVGMKDKHGHQIPLDEICRTCPRRRACSKISIALGDYASGRITQEQAQAIAEQNAP